MKIIHLVWASAFMIAAGMWAGSASAADVRLAGRVPGVCVTGYTPPADPSHGNLGRLSAYCNAATGYMISVRHEGFVSTKSFSWEGRLVAVQPGGQTLLVNSSGPGMHRAELSLPGADEDETAAAARVITIEIVES